MRFSRRARRRLLIGGPLVLVAGIILWGAVPRGPLRITPPPAGAEPGRWVHLEGAANTRDVGGYPAAGRQVVKRGVVYRSGKLNRLSGAGADAYRRLDVRTAIDFCNRLTPWPLFGGDAWSVQFASAVHGCPMSFAKDGPVEEFYIRGVHDNAGSLRKAFDLLSRGENYPVLYHCAVGTDRTGVMTALLLSLLGVDRATIIADFRLSEQVGLPGSLTAMEALLDHVAGRGGIEVYLAELGIAADAQERIRALLLEPRRAELESPP